MSAADPAKARGVAKMEATASAIRVLRFIVCSFENWGWSNFQRAHFIAASSGAHEVLQSVSLLSTRLRRLTRRLLGNYKPLTSGLLSAYGRRSLHRGGAFSNGAAPVRRHEATVDPVLPAPDPSNVSGREHVFTRGGQIRDYQLPDAPPPPELPPPPENPPPENPPRELQEPCEPPLPPPIVKPPMRATPFFFNSSAARR